MTHEPNSSGEMNASTGQQSSQDPSIGPEPNRQTDDDLSSHIGKSYAILIVSLVTGCTIWLLGYLLISPAQGPRLRELSDCAAVAVLIFGVGSYARGRVGRFELGGAAALTAVLFSLVQWFPWRDHYVDGKILNTSDLSAHAVLTLVSGTNRIPGYPNEWGEFVFRVSRSDIAANEFRLIVVPFDEEEVQCECVVASREDHEIAEEPSIASSVADANLSLTSSSIERLLESIDEGQEIVLVFIEQTGSETDVTRSPARIVLLEDQDQDLNTSSITDTLRSLAGRIGQLRLVASAAAYHSEIHLEESELDPLIMQLADPNALARSQALSSLLPSADQAVPRLAAYLARSTLEMDALQRYAYGLSQLSGCCGEEDSPPEWVALDDQIQLVPLLGNSSEAVRRSMTNALINIEDQRLVPSLMEFAIDERVSPEGRFNSLFVTRSLSDNMDPSQRWLLQQQLYELLPELGSETTALTESILEQCDVRFCEPGPINEITMTVFSGADGIERGFRGRLQQLFGNGLEIRSSDVEGEINALWCGPEVDTIALQIVALWAIEAGYGLQYVGRFREVSDSRVNLIQLGRSAEGRQADILSIENQSDSISREQIVELEAGACGR